MNDIIYPFLIGGLNNNQPAPPESHGLKPYFCWTHSGPPETYMPTRYIAGDGDARRIVIVWFVIDIPGGPPNICPVAAVKHARGVMEMESVK